MKKVTLPWMDRLRDRLEEYEREELANYIIMKQINEFVKPLIKYGEQEEKNITKRFKQSKKDNEKAFEKDFKIKKESGKLGQRLSRRTKKTGR